MDPVDHRTIYRYFEPADRFVGIRRVEEHGPGFPTGAGPALDRDGYRRTVVERCVTDLDEVEELTGEHVEELYELVVEVNPELDIRSVRLASQPRAEGQEAPRGGDGFRRRLRRVARDVEARLKRRVIGQEHAIASVARAVRRAAVGWTRRGPLGSLLFVGPTGTGKTEMARALASELGGEDHLVRVDCSEYAEGHEYSKLLGAPPGYVGHLEGGALTRALERTPNAVVLFDEVEKGHSRLHHLLLQVLDEGRLTDGRGIVVDLRKAFVILTSNAGTRELVDANDGLGFAKRELDEASRGEIVERSLSYTFRPEFLARIDEMIVFEELSTRDSVRIAEMHLTDLASRVRRSGPRVRFTQAVARWVARRGVDASEGARGIQHVLRREIEAPMAELLLESGRQRGFWISVSIRGGRPRVERAA